MDFTICIGILKGKGLRLVLLLNGGQYVIFTPKLMSTAPPRLLRGAFVNLSNNDDPPQYSKLHHGNTHHWCDVIPARTHTFFDTILKTDNIVQCVTKKCDALIFIATLGFTETTYSSYHYRVEI